MVYGAVAISGDNQNANLNLNIKWNATVVAAKLNTIRYYHSVPAVAIDPDLNLIAQSWADELIHANAFYHSSNRYGENLAMASSSAEPFDYSIYILNAIDAWYREIKDYNFSISSPGFSIKTGHFTALVWKATTSIGVGAAYSPLTKKIIICMNFNPPGNVQGQFSRNVFPNKSNIVYKPPHLPPPVVISTKKHRKRPPPLSHHKF